MNTIAPQEAIRLASQTAVRYQMSKDATPDTYVDEYMRKIEEVVTHESVDPRKYLQEIRGAAKLQSVSGNSDELSKRRIEFFVALEIAITRRNESL
ncbi:hypothetical protein GOA91_20495 [Sinorhizobium meliloti]|nr:hypothetical protein [Sinorhizobium meliloti]MDX0275822.1 hypothetical protein [Sinorhizobium meliloti]MDX0297987.1 hypothetical protein [Sinorhizobium meliloti]